MPQKQLTPRSGAKADYIEGDPAEPGPIPDGRLDLDSGTLLFHSPGRAGFRIELAELYGMTVSGATARCPGFKPSARGTTRVALRRDRRPMVWEFAIDRSKAVALRERINRALEDMGRSPLPFVEALYEFKEASRAKAVLQEAAPPRRLYQREVRAQRTSEHEQLEAESKRPGKLTPKQRRIVFSVLGAAIALEVIVPLLVVFVF